mmetsp:Transcript_127/g.155  ORF Transcript_127/g.155 Transcript_127/m.155 type:complete len:127 (-) Transcript_127:233-613(-)
MSCTSFTSVLAPLFRSFSDDEGIDYKTMVYENDRNVVVNSGSRRRQNEPCFRDTENDSEIIEQNLPLRRIHSNNMNNEVVDCMRDDMGWVRQKGLINAAAIHATTSKIPPTYNDFTKQKSNTSFSL